MQSFRDLIAESLFSQKRGSPNSVSLRDEQEENRHSHPFNQQSDPNSRILSFKEKKKRPSMSLQSHISVINTIAQENTLTKEKTLRCIP